MPQRRGPPPQVARSSWPGRHRRGPSAPKQAAWFSDLHPIPHGSRRPSSIRSKETSCSMDRRRPPAAIPSHGLRARIIANQRIRHPVQGGGSAWLPAPLGSGRGLVRLRGVLVARLSARTPVDRSCRDFSHPPLVTEFHPPPADVYSTSRTGRPTNRSRGAFDYPPTPSRTTSKSLLPQDRKQQPARNSLPHSDEHVPAKRRRNPTAARHWASLKGPRRGAAIAPVLVSRPFAICRQRERAEA